MKTETVEQRVLRFWRWFEAHEEELFDELAPEAPIYHQFVREFRKIEKGLACDIGSISRGKRELIISAEGNSSQFALVMRVVDSAPKLKRWKFMGFRPRRAEHMNVIFEGNQYETANMFFEPKPRGRKLDLVVWFIDPEGEDWRHIHVAHILVSNLVGEYVYGTVIGEITTDLVDQTLEYPTLLPLVELPSFMDAEFGESLN